MPKRAMSFKPTPECEVQLAELMGRWKCDRTAVLIMAVDVAHKTLMPGEPKVIPKDPKEKVVQPALKATPAQIGVKSDRPTAQETRVLSREEREAKIAEAQKWLGKK